MVMKTIHQTNTMLSKNTNNSSPKYELLETQPRQYQYVKPHIHTVSKIHCTHTHTHHDCIEVTLYIKCAHITPTLSKSSQMDAKNDNTVSIPYQSMLSKIQVKTDQGITNSHKMPGGSSW